MKNTFFNRKFVVQGIFIVVTSLIVARLFYIQILDDRYFLSANNNVMRKKTIYPIRGIIRDRAGEILVQNEPVYDLMVTPNEIVTIDTNLFCSLLNISKSSFIERLEAAKDYSPYRASPFLKQISTVTYAHLQEYLYKFRGFYTNIRTIRNYPKGIASQFVGYIKEVSERDILKYKGYYRSGDYIGASGVERYYEEVLRGKRGIENQLVDVFNRPKGSFKNGKHDTLAVAGSDLIATIDSRLQDLAEKMMINKRGSIVAIEPSSGEILTFVSSPNYNPNELVGSNRNRNYNKLLHDKDKPMFIRPIQASYPPGSLFKVVAALIAQQAGVINEHTIYDCQGGYHYGNSFMRCMHIDGPTTLVKSIKMSCNSYYGYVYDKMIKERRMSAIEAYDLWRDALGRFGLGQNLGIDLPGEKPGFVPTSGYYTKSYGNDKWTSSFNMSLSIGQGELGITPLQMANIMSIVANRGFYYRPHFIKAIGESAIVNKAFTEKISAGVDSKYFEPVIEGMSQTVNKGGTGASSRIQNIEMCGKTGTVENSHGENHAVFFAFAPRDNPQIAIAVFVENAGYGSTWAAPIASMLVEKYINDTITLPTHIQNRIFNNPNLPEIEILSQDFRTNENMKNTNSPIT